MYPTIKTTHNSVCAVQYFVVYTYDAQIKTKLRGLPSMQYIHGIQLATETHLCPSFLKCFGPECV